MVTVIEARRPDGSLTRRCDARCYAAKGTTCRCICGGINHGVGLRQTIDNLEKDRLVREPEAVYCTRLMQGSLFTQEE